MCTSEKTGARVGAAEALFTKTQRAVLGLLFCHADEWYHLNEVVRRTGAGMGAVQRELARLLAAGLVVGRNQANLACYRAKRESPLFAPLRELMIKTVGVADVLRNALEPLRDRVRVAFVYGSVAAGTEPAQSDIDLMVVGNLGLADVVPVLRSAQETLGREVNPSVYTPEEFAERAMAGRSFVRRVIDGPRLPVIGNDDDLGRLAA